MLSENFVYFAALLNVVGEASYVVATLQGRTKPNRISWFLWALAPFLAVAGALDEGVGVQVLMTFIVGFGPACIFVASFFNPNAFWKIGKLDIVCGVLSVCGLLMWIATREGNVAIAAAIAADGLAAIPTLVKSYRHPDTEDAGVFWLAGGAALITLITLDTWDFAHVGFPAYIFTICLLIAVLVTSRIGERLSPASKSETEAEMAVPLQADASS
jgi:hypothetical protein